VVVDPSVLQGNERLVTLHLKDVSAKQTLKMVMKLTGLAYLLQDGFLIITTPEGARREADADLRIYDVRDFAAVAGVGATGLNGGATGTGAIGAGTAGLGAISNTLSTGNTYQNQNVQGQNTTGTGTNNSAAMANLMTLIVMVTGPEYWGMVGVLGAATTANQTTTPIGSF